MLFRFAVQGDAGQKTSCLAAVGTVNCLYAAAGTRQFALVEVGLAVVTQIPGIGAVAPVLKIMLRDFRKSLHIFGEFAVGQKPHLFFIPL